MSRILFSVFFLLAGIQAFSANKSAIELEKQSDVSDIDNLILELEEKKRGYEAAALRHEDQAERLQFDRDTYLEARRHMELADENREVAKRLQIEIDRLKKERSRLLRENGDEMLPGKGGDGLKDL